MKPNVNIDGRIQLKHDTKEHWESVQAIFTPRAGELIIYDDYKIDKSGKKIPGIKIGNGNSFVRDLPFIDDIVYEQIKDFIQNNPSLIPDEDRNFWSNKIDCYIDPIDSEHLIFTRTKEAIPNT